MSEKNRAGSARSKSSKKTTRPKKSEAPRESVERDEPLEEVSPQEAREVARASSDSERDYDQIGRAHV